MRIAILIAVMLAVSGVPLAAADLAPSLSTALAAKIAADPLAFVGKTGKLIGRFGGPAGLDAAGVDKMVRVTRARGRARYLGRVLVADLDGDLAITAAERDEALAAQGKKQGEALSAQIQAADADGDGNITRSELDAALDRAGQEALPDSEAAELREIIKFDRNADGAVTESELLAGVAQVLTSVPQG